MTGRHLYPPTGFTLIETLVVISLMAIIAGLSLPYGIESYNRGLAGTDRLLILAALREARAEAMNGVCESSRCTEAAPHGVSIFTDHLILFEGPSYENRSISADQVIPFSEKETLSETSSSIVFLPGTADVSEPFSVSVTGNDGLTETIQINPEGAIFSSGSRAAAQS